MAKVQAEVREAFKGKTTIIEDDILPQARDQGDPEDAQPPTVPDPTPMPQDKPGHGVRHP